VNGGFTVKFKKLAEFFAFLGVKLNKFFLASGNFRIHENSVYWANRRTGTTLNALIRMNVKLGFTIKFVDAIYRANANTGFIFNINAGFTNYERHSLILPNK
jgi:hypothetical protein